MADQTTAVNKYNTNAPASSQKWANHVAQAYQDYINGVASFLGVDPATIQNSMPVKRWSNFANNATALASAATKYATNVTGKGQRWLERYKEAYTGTGGGATVAPAPAGSRYYVPY